MTFFEEVAKQQEQYVFRYQFAEYDAKGGRPARHFQASGCLSRFAAVGIGSMVV